MALGAKPLSPKQIEKSNVLANNRRRDCSQVREVEETEVTICSDEEDEQIKQVKYITRLRSKSQVPIRPLNILKPI